ncbi:helix-turn-helix transcriptional regulator [Myroides sp. JBRI-B21084]|uniref:helix-turn-helix domain-containing protein n=1 Tax=Myroides sp. JBRI-B21084 TaxID=3119977 RepID=UPI0026E313AB|nr:helix-turn-helix transcriptional regulator [Paenimyroides cloacae]WKW46933.1 helix-turn-helix transcriptional regulator [Paenimyroides cloacae]
MNTIIGKKLQALRKERGFSQEQVADKLHISQSAYARIESGESHSWASHILKICETYEITPEELVSSENIVINNHQQGGGGYIQINQLSEKLIQQYEERIKEKDLIIKELRNRLA